MRLSVATNNNETKNVQTAQVNNPVTVAPTTPAIEDAVAEEIVDEPKAKPVTLKKKVTIKKKTAAPKPTANSQQPTTYSVVLLPTKDGGQWPKLYGFESEEQAKAIADRMPKSVTASWDYGPNGEGRETKTKHWCLKAGKRYCGVAKQLCEALNSGDKKAIDKAIAASMGVYDIAKAEGQAEREAKKKEEPAPAKPAAKAGYTSEQVAAMLRDVLAGKELPKDVAELIAA